VHFNINTKNPPSYESGFVWCTRTGERVKTIEYRFHDAKSTKQGAEDASLREAHSDYATRHSNPDCVAIASGSTSLGVQKIRLLTKADLFGAPEPVSE